MSFFKALNNNFKHDIWGNYLMTRQVGRMAGVSFLARRSWALAKAVAMNRIITINNRDFFDTWNF
ncbi:MAG: hypothetical protein KKB20_07860 [Proteobacteria bacterium]|nr:hypothetical protein [Pseudomonadota bacterium]